MASISEKLKGQTSATPHEVVETDHDNLKLSKEQFIAKYRKKAEIKAKLKAEQARLEAEAAAEEKALIEAGQEDNVKTETTEKTNEE